MDRTLRMRIGEPRGGLGSLALGVACAWAFAAAASPWQPTLPADGRVEALATHAAQAGVVLSLSLGPGRVFDTLDGGASWWQSSEWPLAPEAAYVAHRVRAFVAGTPRVAYAQVNTRPMQSPDDGRTWHDVRYALPAGFDATHFLAAVNPQAPAQKVIHQDTKVAVTLDDGAHWRVDEAPDAVRFLDVDWSTRRMYVALGAAVAGKPIDAAGTWTASAHVPDGSFDAPVAAGGGAVFIVADRTDGGFGQWLFRSIDGGATFQRVGAEVDAQNLCDVAFAPSQPSRVYALSCLNGVRLLRSDDTGATWLSFPAQTEGGVLVVDGANPDVVWIGANGLWKSTNAGASFVRVERSSGAPGVGRPVFFDAADPLVRYATGYFARLLSTDGGATWTVEPGSGPNPYTVVWASRARANVVLGHWAGWFFGGEFCYLATSHDRGSSFGATPLGCGNFYDGALVIADGPRAGEVYVFFRRGNDTDVHVSVDDMETWPKKATLPGIVPTAAASTGSAAAAVYLGVETADSAPGLYRSSDGGSTWIAVAAVPRLGTVSAVAVDPGDANHVYIGFADAGSYPLWHSADGGLTWSRAGAGLGTGQVVAISIDPAAPASIVAVQAGSGVFGSADRGATWQPMDDGLRGASGLARGVRRDPRTPSQLALWTMSGNFATDLATGAPTGARRAIEYYHAAFHHYFVSADLDEIAGLDAGVFQGWARTGESFRVAEGDDSGNLPVCRFFGVGFAPLSSHFYTPYPAECDIVKADPKWFYEKVAFGLALPDGATHGCPPGTRPLYRLWNVNRDGAPNHRYTTSMATFDVMRNLEWIFEGEKETRVFACVPE